MSRKKRPFHNSLLIYNLRVYLQAVGIHDTDCMLYKNCKSLIIKYYIILGKFTLF